MLNFLKKITAKTENVQYGFYTDMHSHLLPNLDDGVQSFEQALVHIQELQNVGVKKIITTPHIYAGKYNNSANTILPKLAQLKTFLIQNNCQIDIQAAAEYYLDDTFLNNLKSNQPILTFGDDYVLFELSYINESHLIYEAVYTMLSLGYKPILAHPERYNYYHFNMQKYQDLKNLGLLFQLNINALSGYYKNDCRKMAEKLIDAQMIDFVGSDTHHGKHTEALRKSINTKYYKKLLTQSIKNNEL